VADYLGFWRVGIFYPQVINIVGDLWVEFLFLPCQGVVFHDSAAFSATDEMDRRANHLLMTVHCAKLRAL
jgi:fructosamine-3-kinase